MEILDFVLLVQMQDMMLLKKELMLLSIGTVVTLVTFLIASYFGSFVTKSAYAKDRTVIEVMANDIRHIRNSLKEIKDKIK